MTPTSAPPRPGKPRTVQDGKRTGVYLAQDERLAVEDFRVQTERATQIPMTWNAALRLTIRRHFRLDARPSKPKLPKG